MYYYNLVQALVNKGYERGISVMGAPYDWRRAPHENEDWMRNFKALVENTVQRNGNKPAIILCHSMGCMFSYYFFMTQVDQNWRKTKIRAWIINASPLGGNFKYMYGFFGDNDWPATPFPKIRVTERTFSSMVFLMPLERAYGRDTPFIQTPTRNYTVSDYRDFFSAVGSVNGYEQWLDIKDLLQDFPQHPGMDIHCLGGTGIQTMERAVFDNEKLMEKQGMRVLFGDGDGTVPSKSMRECLKFQGQVPASSSPSSGDEVPTFDFREFPLDHMEMIQHDSSVSHMVKIITTMT
jgi:lysophospholipase-3